METCVLADLFERSKMYCLSQKNKKEEIGPVNRFHHQASSLVAALQNMHGLHCVAAQICAFSRTLIAVDPHDELNHCFRPSFGWTINESTVDQLCSRDFRDFCAAVRYDVYGTPSILVFRL